MSQQREFVVVGAGLVGLATAEALRHRGRDVVCLERSSVGNEKAGSKGAVRIFRSSYDDPLYVEMAIRSSRGWSELADIAGVQLFHQTGLLSFGDYVDELAYAMRQRGAAHEVLEPEDSANRFQGIVTNGRAVFEAAAGVLRADLAISALCAQLGDEHLVVDSPVIGIDEFEDSVRVRTAGTTYECEVVVLCAGAWSGPICAAAGLAGADCLWASAQQVAYLAPGAGTSLNLPAFVERGGNTYFGLPIPGETSYKVGIHDAGPATDPDQALRGEDGTELASLAAMAMRVLPGCSPNPVASERCYYDNTPDGDFIMDRVGRIVIGAGSSGHGFKFGPIWGEVLADLALGVTPWLSLERFSWHRLKPAPSGFTRLGGH